jgi:hypothetical protein
MGKARKAKRRTPALAAAFAVAIAIWAPASGDASASPRCPSFESQADAQTYFFESGGSPSNDVSRLDADRDGVACEGLGAPYQGFATLGFNRKRGFFYGVASMPPLVSGQGEYACLTGNRFDPESARLLRIYRVRASGDVAVFGGRTRPAEVRPSGKLVWKADWDLPGPGRYYVAFEAAMKTRPYGPAPCPEFRSRTVSLP